MTWRTLERYRLPRGRSAAAFATHDAGGVTVFSVISFAMLMVMVGLVVDVGRVMNVHTQVNSYADRVALAAATELDGRPGAPGVPSALQRAVTAARGGLSLVDDPGFRFSLSGDTSMGVRCLTFLSRLGPDPVDPFEKSPVSCDASRPWPCFNPNLDCATATWTPGDGFRFAPGIVDINQASRESSFIIVDPEPETERYIFFPLLAGWNADVDRQATVAPEAIAGFKRELCNTAPLMVCNPTEISASGQFNMTPGQLMRARLQGGTTWNTDSFSLLDVPSTGSTALRDYMARTTPGTACHGDRVVVERNLNGSSTTRNAIRDGLNVRFDMYPSNALYVLRNDSRYVPARNVTKGLHTDVVGFGSNRRCTTTQSDTTIPFPRDASWSRSTYWSRNFSGTRPATLHTGVPYLSATRYQIYREEIEWNPPGRVNQDPFGDGEQGAPFCSSQAGTTDPLNDRRVLQVAVVNCVANRSRLNAGQSVEVEAYAEMFMSEPMANTAWGAANNELDLEFIGPPRPTLPEIALREFPVLYR